MNRHSGSGIRTDKILVTTKFAPPRPGTKTIVRQRLLEDLQQMQHCSVGLVVASPGFGKTTLLAQWRQAMLKAGAEVGWLSLSVDDQFLPTFCVYLQGALQRLGVALESSLSFDISISESLDEIIAGIVDQIVQLQRELYLIIDDYHHVTDPRAHRLMQKLLDHCPGNLHLVLVSRTAPPLNLGRLRVNGQVLVIDCAALPFDLNEMRDFFEKNLASLKLSAEEFHLINDLSGGWPASLQLIRLMLKNDPQARTTLRDLAWKSGDLNAYLSEDVMAHLPADLADFMESLSICRRFNATLASAITGHANALALLRRMDEENLLIFRVETDDRRSWYRFHPLFGEFLAARLSRRDSAAVIELHKRAARWLGDQGYLAEAVRHAIQSGDNELAVELVEGVTHNPLDLDYVRPLLRLLDRLPHDVLFSRPQLLCLYCLCHTVLAQPAKAQALLDQLERNGATSNGNLAHNLPLLRAAIELQQDRTERIIELLDGYLPLADDHSLVRYSPLTLMSFAYAAEGRFDEAIRYIDTYPVPPADRDNEIAMLGENARILCHLFEGRIREAEVDGPALLARAIALHGHRSNSGELCAASVAEIYRELDRIDEAREALANRSAVLQWAIPALMLRATLCRARLDLLQESPAQALNFLERQERHFLRTGQERVAAHVLAEQVRISLIAGDRAKAEAQMVKLENLTRRFGNAPGIRAEIPVQAALAKARLMLASAYPEQSLNLLSIVQDYSLSHNRRQLLVTVLILQALALDDLRRADDLQLIVVHALTLGNKLGLIRTFIDEGPMVQRLLARLADKLADHKDLAAYLSTLLEHFPAQGATPRNEGLASAPTKAILTPREVVILQLIGQTMSNKRIALTLSISLETVKWNLKNIYVKLGVSSRYDAMSWARNHDVIS